MMPSRETLDAAKAFLKVGQVDLDTIQLEIASLSTNEDENEEEIEALRNRHDNLEIAMSRVEDVVQSVEEVNA